MVWLAEADSDWVVTGNIAADVNSVLNATNVSQSGTFGIVAATQHGCLHAAAADLRHADWRVLLRFGRNPEPGPDL